MRRVPAILIAVFLACPLLFTCLVTFSVSTWMLDRHFYLSLFDDARLLQVPDAVSSATWSAQVVEGTGGLQWRSIARAAGTVLTPEYLQGQAQRVVNQVFDWFDGKARQLDITIDAAPVKAALRGDAGRQFSLFLAQDLPVDGSPSDFTVRPGRLPVSRPSTLPVGRAAAIIEDGLPTFMSGIPDTLHLTDFPLSGSWLEKRDNVSPGVTRGTGWWGPRFNLFGGLLSAAIILLLFGAGFLTAAAFVGGETKFERLQWYGWPLLVPAAGVLLIGLFVLLSVMSPWVRWEIENARLDILGFNAAFISALVDTARHVVSRIAVGFLATGGIAAGAALGLLAWSWSIPHIERKGASA
jgi:hypothetical protein